MKRLIIGFIAIAITSVALALEPKQEFEKTARSFYGEYELAKGSNPKCAGGAFRFVGDKFDQGIHLGHDVFVGPFAGKDLEQEDGYCAVDHSFKFTDSSVTHVTKISRCPASHKGDESVATKVLRFEKEQIIYEVKESKFKCVFSKKIGKDDE